MDALAELFIAPVHSWDALICTSQAVYDTVYLVLDSWQDYLTERLNARPSMPLLTPIIPLGIDCDEFQTPAEKPNRLEKYLREGETVVTYVGRLNHLRKAHPLPMFLSLQEAVRRTGTRVRLFLVGWFQNESQAKAFQELGHEFAPDVRITALDGNKTAVVADAWRITDIFMSLSDNIQETFGLTPIEAMAAGIPVVVSDWNGYKETVQHGVEGFRVPTMLPPSGTGDRLAERFGSGRLSYEQYIGTAAASCVVEVDRCAEYLSELLRNPELRRKMGAAGRKRARQCYDWSVIIPQYEELWRELVDRRRSAGPRVRAGMSAARHPLRQDPFRVFASYASTVIDQTMWLELASANPRDDLAQIKRHEMNLPRAAVLASDAEMRSILNQLRHGSIPFDALLATRPAHEHPVWYRTVAWLAKVGLLRLKRPGSD